MKTKIQEVAGALLPPPVKRAPNTMSLEELSGHSEWKQLDPFLKRLLTSYFGSGAKLVDVLKAFNLMASDETIQQQADAILARTDVRDVLALHSGKSLKQ